MEELKTEFTIVIVTHNMQQAARTSDRTAFFTAEVDDRGSPGRAARRVRRHREAVHLARPTPAPRDTSRGGSVEHHEPAATRADRRARTGADEGTAGVAGRDDGARPVAGRARRAPPGRARPRRRRQRGVPQPCGRALPRGPSRRRRRRRRARLSRRARPRRRAVSSASSQLFGPPRSVVHLAAVPLGTASSRWASPRSSADVSEMHRVESVRRDFVANVSHELKTPIGALEVLAETLVAEDDPAVTRPLAERMVKEAERLGAHRRRPARPEPDRDAGVAAACAGAARRAGRRRGRPAATCGDGRRASTCRCTRASPVRSWPATGARWSARSRTSSTTR